MILKPYTKAFVWGNPATYLFLAGYSIPYALSGVLRAFDKFREDELE